MNLGVDAHMAGVMPRRYSPGIGLRPGGERPDLEPLVVRFYAALYESIAAHSRLGLHVVSDFGHHDSFSMPRGVLADCAQAIRQHLDTGPAPTAMRRLAAMAGDRA